MHTMIERELRCRILRVLRMLRQMASRNISGRTHLWLHCQQRERKAVFELGQLQGNIPCTTWRHQYV